MKMIIEVSGGVVTNISSTDYELRIYLVDHDNIKEKGDDASNAREALTPDTFFEDNDSIMKELDNILSDYDKPEEEANLTEEQKADYIDQGGVRCPYCESDDISGSSTEINDGIVTQCVVCGQCDKRWSDVYKLVSIYEEG